MFPQKHKSTIYGLLIARLHYLLVLVGFCVLSFATFLSTHGVQTAYAATSSTLNFQGRLYTSSGSVVPDGYYNIQFKLYDGGTSGGPGGTGQANAGTNLWTESYYDSNGVTAGNDNRLRVVNGYFSANLGSQTAFPGTINWDQELWLTMNVGGTTQTATPTYDGEMLQTGNTRTKLTGVPYAFRAGSAAGVTSNNTNAASTDSDSVSISTGNAAGATSNSGNLTIDTGTATGTAGTISIGETNTSGIGIGNSGAAFTLQGSPTSVIDIISGGSTTSIQFQSPTANVNYRFATAAAGNYDICTTAGNCLGAGDIIQGGNTYGTAVTIGTNDNYGLNFEVNNTTVQSFTNIGAVTFKNTSDSSTAFQIQNTANQSLFTVDTTSAGAISLLGNSDGEITSWTTNTNSLPANRFAGGVVTANGYIYVLGGGDGSQIQDEVYYAKINANGSIGSFSTTTALPNIRSDFQAAYGNGYIYVIAGYQAGTVNTIYYAKVNADGTVGSWQTGTNTLTAARQDGGTVIANGYVYVIGGSNSGGGSEDTVYYAKLASNGSVGSWATTSVLPGSRHGISAVTANGYVYIFGGNNGGGTQTSSYYAKINTDGTLGTWATTTAIPVAQEFSGATVQNGKVYVIGGRTAGAGTQVATVYYASLNSDGTVGSWSTSSHPLTTDTHAPFVTSANGYIYSIGGMDSSSTVLDDVYYTSTARVSIGGNLDLVNLSGENLAEGGSAGSITAGNGTFVGTLDVQDQARFYDSLYIEGNLNSSGAALFQNASNSTTAFQIQNAAGTSNLFIADTTNTKIGIGKAPVNGTLDVNGIVAASQYYTTNGIVFTNTGQSAISKQVTAGTTGFAQYDVVVFDSTSTGTDKVITTTTARDNRVYGVATAAAASGGSTYVATSGTYTINVDTGAVAAGDQLVTSTTAGRATVDNNATTGIIGIALSSKSGGSNGTVSVSIRPVGGQYSPIFRNASDSTTAFQIQNSGGTNILTVDSTNQTLAIGTATPGTTAKLRIDTSSYTNLLLNATGAGNNILELQKSGTNVVTVANAGATTFQNQANSTSAFQIQNATGTQLFGVDTTNSIITVGNSLDAQSQIQTPYGGFGNFGNLLARSEQFDNATWIKANVTAPTADTDNAPDGNPTAETLADSSSGGSVAQTSTTAPTNNTYAFSVWLKTSSGTQSVDLRIDGATTGTGTKKTVTATTGWQRFFVAQNTNGFTGNIKVLIFPGGTGGSGTVSAWGAQLVLSSVPSIYARTGSTASTTTTGLYVNGTSTIQNAVDSTSAFSVKNSSGSTIFNVDTTNSVVGTGNATTSNSSTLSLRTGNSSAGNSGNLNIDVGTATGTAGNIAIGGTNPASQINVGGASVAGSIAIGGSSQTGTITLGQSTATNTINIGTVIGAAATQTINIGTSGTASSVTTLTLGSLIGTSATTIQSGSGNITMQAAGTSTIGVIQIGAGGAGSSTPDYLALDVKSTTGDPAGGANGYMYYNTADAKFRCYENGAWKDCDTNTAGTVTLQSVYDNDADGSDSIITLSTADDGIIIRNPAASGSDSTYNLTLDQLSTGANGGLSIQSAGTGNLLLITDTTATASDVLTVADKGWTTFKNQTNGSNAFQILNSTSGVLFNANTSTNIVDISSLNINGTATNGLNLSNGTFSGLAIKDNAGDQVNVFNNWSPQRIDLAYGTAASPITTAGPSVKISRTESISAATCGGNAVDNECNAALVVESKALTGSGMQPAAIFAGAQGSGASDVNGLQAVGRITGTGTGLAAGAYLEGRRDTNTATAVGTEIRVTNETATDGTYNTGGVSNTTGIWLTTNSSSGSDSGVGIGLASVAGSNSQWVVGLGFTNGSVKTASISDDSSAVTSIDINGTHTYGVDLQGATFSAGAIRLGNQQSITVRNNANSTDLNILTTNTTDQLLVGTGAAGVIVKPGSNNPTAFQVQTTTGTNVLQVDTQNSRVGVGITNPGYTLDVSSTDNIQLRLQGSSAEAGIILNPVAGSASKLLFQDGGTTKFEFGKSAANNFNLYDNANGRDVFQATSAGNVILQPVGGSVGIGAGATNPQALLHISGPGGGSALFRVTDTTATSRDVLNIADGGAATFRNQTDSTAAFQIQNALGTSNLFVADTTNTRIGIGTAAPGYTLDVAGDVNTQAVRDAIGWVQNQGGVEKLKTAINNGSFGGGASINKQSLTSNDLSFFDSSTVNSNSKSFASAVFDGRYIYFVPFYRATGTTFHGQVTRYDTTKDYSSTSSYSVFDMTGVNANSKGFLGAAFDGRYIYYIPYATAAGTGNGQITRYDTQASFTSTSSYSVYDTTAVNANSKGFVGGVFDGRYLYLVPYNTGAAYSGQITRYDTTASFTSAGSYSVYDTTAVNANSKGFYGAVFDGKYIYFVPNVTAAGPTYSGQVTRYDTTASFTSSGSYSVYDTTAVNASSKGFQGAVFDGRYIYYVPYATASTTASGLVTRYDTYGTFNSASSYSTYDMGNVSATAKGFDGGFFDGKYVYFIPHYNVSGSPTFHGNLARYDTSQSFTSASSYTVLDTGAVNASSKGFVGGAFDGRYLYLSPYSLNGANNGQITRVKTYSGGVDTLNSINKIATSSEFLIGSNGSVSLQNNTNSTAAFQIQNATGTAIFKADTTNADIVINGGSGYVSQSISSAAGQSRDLTFDTAGVDRWILRANGTAESGSNAGSDFELINRSDAGAALGTPLKITRSNGAVVFRNSTDGTSGFIIQNQAQSNNVLVADTSNGRIGINIASTSSPSADLTFGEGATRTVNVLTRTTNAAGNGLTLIAGTAGTGASAFAGGTLTLQGGAAAGSSGNANGGAVTISGGAAVGSGTQGLVNLSTSAFTSAAEQSFSSSTSVTAGNVDLYSSLPVKAITNTGLVLTVPDPGQTTVGRLLYIAARSGSLDFTLRLNSARTPIDINMKANSTATLIWNGTDWTAAGASSSTDLQAAYNNTVSSAGGAELVLNASGGAADGLTVRNNGTTPIIGGLLEVQSSTGSNLFAVNNNATEYATNGGSETAGGSSTTFPSNTWSQSATGGTQATISRTITAGEFATGVAAAKVVTTGATTANQGIANQIAVNGTNTALTANLTYTVAFTVKGTANFSTLDVVYSRDGTNTSTTSCTTGKTVTQTVWTRVGCTFTAPSSGITTSNAIFIRQSDSNSNARTFYIDNLSVTVSANTNHAVDGSVDSALGTNWTTFGAGTAVTRDTTTLYDTSGSVKVDTTNNTDRGVTNNLTIAPSTSTQYLVTFYAKLGSGTFTDIRVRYSRDGGTNFVTCADYNTQALSTSVWTKITCLFTTDSTTATNADLIIDQPTAPGSTRTFYVDALSVTLNTNNANNVQIGGGSKGGPVTLFTLDRSAGAPIAANNDAYLGSMYYDTTTGRIQCYESAGWGTCGAPPDNIVNLNPEYAGAVLNGTGVGTMTTDLCSNDTALSVNTTLCSTGQAKNFYKWTSPQATQQTYSIYVSYQLPATFNGFSSDDTVQLIARVDNTTNASVTYQMFKSTGSAVTQCGSGETDVITGGGGSANTWYSYGINGNEATGCSFTSSSAGNYLLFKINLKANSNANAYVSTLSFTTTGR